MKSENNNNIKILQWNMNGFNKKYEEITILIQDHNPDIICIQETNYKNDNITNLSNYDGYNKNRTDSARASGGVAIYIKSIYPSRQLTISTDIEAIVVTIKLTNNDINICNIYLPNHKTFDQTDINNIIKQLPKPFIIVGDFNSHNVIWGSDNTDQRGKVIEKILDDNDIILLNNTEPTRLNPINGNLSHIDLSFASTSLAQRINWNVTPNLTSSDHFPIILQILYRSYNSKIDDTTERWNLKNPNWDLYTELLELEMDNIKNIDSLNIDSLVKSFTDAITKTAELTIGKNMIKPKKPKVPWWNDDIKNAIKIKNKALNQFKKTKNLTDYIILKKQRALTKYMIKLSKKKSWEMFINNINEETDTKLIWKKIHSLKGIKQNFKINLIDEKSTKLITNPNEISNKLGTHFHSNSNDTSYSPNFIKYKYEKENTPIINTTEPNNINQLQINSKITRDEIVYTLKKCKSLSPGPDGIPFIFIQYFGPKTQNILEKIYNTIWSDGSFPSTWKKGIIIPINKPGKCKFNTEGYRPITLLNTMCKVLEKIVNFRLIWFLEKINYLTPSQSGFRKNRSTYDNLTTIKKEAEQALQNKQILGLLSIDISKAYDVTWRHYILSKLNKVICNGNMLNFITNFLRNRSFQVKISNQLSDIFTQENGVPQGSALSVTLFLVAINKIDKHCKYPIKANIFADDANFLCRSKNIKTIQYHLQETVKQLEKWSSKTGFSFSTEKSNCIIFTRKSNIGELNIKMNNKIIPNKKVIKILGVTFDSRLTWSQHIKSLKISTNKALRLIKLLSHTNWGSETETLIKIFKSTIQAKLYYGSILYNTAKNTLIKYIDANHNTGMRMAIGAFKSSPIKSIYNIAGEPTPDLKRIELTLLYAARLSRLTNNPTSTNNITIELQLKKNTNYSKIPQIIKKEKIISSPWTSIYKINTELNSLHKENTPPLIYKNHLKSILENLNEFKELYTDASKSDDGVGIAIIKNNLQTSFKLPSTCSIYTAEALAILIAIKYINKKVNQKYIILSDSLSSLISVKNKFNPSDIAIHIQNRLEEAKEKNNNIIIIWIPGHIGIIGNEMADKQAKLAINSSNSQYINISSFTDIRKQIKQDTMLIWQNIWNVQTNKLNQVKQTVERWKRNPNMSTSNEKKLNRARIGHTRLTHGHLMKKGDPPICESCGYTITIKHIFEECRKYEKQREELNISHQIGTSLGPNPENEINTIKFFKKIKILNLL